jgi:hypothetical protein
MTRIRIVYYGCIPPDCDWPVWRRYCDLQMTDQDWRDLGDRIGPIQLRRARQDYNGRMNRYNKWRNR